MAEQPDMEADKLLAELAEALDIKSHGPRYQEDGAEDIVTFQASLSFGLIARVMDAIDNEGASDAG